MGASSGVCARALVTMQRSLTTCNLLWLRRTQASSDRSTKLVREVFVSRSLSILGSGAEDLRMVGCHGALGVGRALLKPSRSAGTASHGALGLCRPGRGIPPRARRGCARGGPGLASPQFKPATGPGTAVPRPLAGSKRPGLDAVRMPCPQRGPARPSASWGCFGA